VRRREFITLLGSAVTWPLAARAQQSSKLLPTIGLLGPTAARAQPQWAAGFFPRLQELGWMEGHNLAVEYRWAEGHIERFAEIATELVNLKVDVIVTSGTQTVIAAKQATMVIPIVFMGAGDPVGNALVASLARPGGNVTGMSVQQPDSAGKRIELLREVVPSLRKLAIMANVGAPASVQETHEVQATAKKLSLAFDTLEIRQAEDIAPAFEGRKGRPDALYVVTDPVLTANRIRINNLALSARLPTIFTFRDNVEAGGLMSYGPSLLDLSRRTADFVDKILRGAKPSDLPVEQPTKFELSSTCKPPSCSAFPFHPRCSRSPTR
jgi:putative ABC transport system substrate-binding protein